MDSQLTLGAEDSCGRLDDQAGIAQQRDRDPPHASRVIVGGQAGCLRRKTGLPGPAGTRHREQVDVRPRQHGINLGELAVAAEERCCRDRQVRLIQRLQRRELAVP